MAPAEDNNGKGKSKRNKRKKVRSTNSKRNDDAGDSAGDIRIDILAMISVGRDCRQSQEAFQRQQQRRLLAQLEGQPKQQAFPRQQQSGHRDEGQDITADLERQPVLIQVETIAPSSSGRSYLVFITVRLKPTESNGAITCVYLGEAHRTVAHVPTERPLSNDILLYIDSAVNALTSTISYLEELRSLHKELYDFYKQLVNLSSQAYKEIRKDKNLRPNLHLLESYIPNIPRFSLTTSIPSTSAKRKTQTGKSKMIHQGDPNAEMAQGVVNSTSLENVPFIETIDGSHSIQSLHSATDTPTPDSTPSLDELQQRLEEYNRHIEQMNEQKDQLTRMQNDAKQHLMLLEQYQKDCKKNKYLSESGQGDGSGVPLPDYEIVSNMTTLSRRCENVAQLVGIQRDLVNRIPGDNDLLADQAILEEKLRNLRREGYGIRAMASELDTLNTNALRRDADGVSTTSRQSEGERVVPIRIAANEPSSLKTIEQKEADIVAIKDQLRQLKAMMHTIESIENKASSAEASPSKQTIASSARNVPIRTVAADSLSCTSHDDDHERTPTPGSALKNTDLKRNIRIVHSINSDVLAQNKALTNEIERIEALQIEVSRHQQQAAAAAKLGDDSLKTLDAIPTPTPLQRKDSEHDAYDKPNDGIQNVILASNQEYAPIYGRSVETARQQSLSRESISSAEHGSNLPVQSIENIEGAPSINNPTGLNIQDDIAPDASNMQSNGSTSHAFTIPPSMATIGGGVTWAGGPHNWNYPNFRYTHPTTVMSPTCGFPPAPPTFAVPPFVSVPPPPPVSLSVLTGPPTAANSFFYNPSHATPTGTATTIPPVISQAIIDQTMLQHYVNQQQLFSQVLNQLSSMVWQQQREIDYLNRVTLTLQERLLRMGGESLAHAADISIGFRSESMPPTFTAAGITTHPPFNLATNIFPNDSNRAQSEQPLGNSSDANAVQYHQEQHHYVQQQQHHHQLQQQRQQFSSNMGMGAGASSGTFSETQHHTSSSAASGGNNSIYSTLNNASVAGRNMRTMQSTSGHDTAAGPAPIFMHHHNNAIHQNNANLRRANVHAHTHAHTHSSSNDTNNTLNNQVPPGNRANNYWDNFKSYSRQNLLAPNSRKSNEGNRQLQLEFDAFDNGEYRPENPRQHQVFRRHARPTHDLRSLNDPNLTGVGDTDDYTNRNNSDLRLGNQPRIKNFQQHRHQQPNPLPSGTVITNPLHANVPTSDINTYLHTGMPPEIPDSHLYSFNYPANELEDQITAEIYGCNYEHPSTSTSHATNINERNINFGNSPSNRQGNKVALKFQYPIGLLTEQSLRVIESFLERWDKEEIQEELLNNRQTVNQYLRELHQLQSTLRFDPSYIGPTATSDYIDRQLYMREEYGDPEDAFYEQSDDNRNSENDARGNDDVNINRAASARSSNLNRFVFEHNLLVNNRNARKPEKFVKKQTVSVTSQRLPCQIDDGIDENRATFSDSTDQRRGSKNRIAGYGRKSEDIEWGDQSRTKNIQRDREATTTIRHSLSDSNVTDTRSDVLDPSLTSEATQRFPITTVFTDKIASPRQEIENLTQQDEPYIHIESQEPAASKVVDYNTEHVLDDSNTCEDIDSLGASSLAAQEHFQKKAILKKKSKERKTMDKQNKPKSIAEEERASTEESKTESHKESQMDKAPEPEKNNDEITHNGSFSAEERTPGRHTSRKEQFEDMQLDSHSRNLIDAVIKSVGLIFSKMPLLNKAMVKHIAIITASISERAFNEKEFPKNNKSLVLLCSERLLFKIEAESIHMPTAIMHFLPWYENYLAAILWNANAYNSQQNGSNRELHADDTAVQNRRQLPSRDPSLETDLSGDEMDIDSIEEECTENISRNKSLDKLSTGNCNNPVAEDLSIVETIEKQTTRKKAYSFPTDSYTSENHSINDPGNTTYLTEKPLNLSSESYDSHTTEIYSKDESGSSAGSTEKPSGSFGSYTVENASMEDSGTADATGVPSKSLSGSSGSHTSKIPSIDDSDSAESTEKPFHLFTESSGSYTSKKYLVDDSGNSDASRKPPKDEYGNATTSEMPSIDYFGDDETPEEPFTDDLCKVELPEKPLTDDLCKVKLPEKPLIDDSSTTESIGKPYYLFTESTYSSISKTHSIDDSSSITESMEIQAYLPTESSDRNTSEMALIEDSSSTPESAEKPFDSPTESFNIHTTKKNSIDSSVNAKTSEEPSMDSSVYPNTSEEPSIDNSGNAETSVKSSTDDSANTNTPEKLSIDDSANAKTPDKPSLDNSDNAKTPEKPSIDDSANAKTPDKPSLDNSDNAKTPEKPSIDDSANATTAEKPSIDDSGNAEATEKPFSSKKSYSQNKPARGGWKRFLKRGGKH